MHVSDESLPAPTEEQGATCVNCGRAIIWYFDRDLDAPGPSRSAGGTTSRL